MRFIFFSVAVLSKAALSWRTEGRVIVKVNPTLTGYTAERLTGTYRRSQEHSTHR